MSKSILESYYQKSIHHSQSLALLSLEPHSSRASSCFLFVCVSMAMLGLSCTMWDLAPCVLCLVVQSCPTPCNPMNCSPPGSSVHGDSPVMNTGVGCHALFQGVFPTQESNPGLLHCRRILHWLSHQGSPLAPWPGVKPQPPTVETQNLKHWTAREVPAALAEVYSYMQTEVPTSEFSHSSLSPLQMSPKIIRDFTETQAWICQFWFGISPGVKLGFLVHQIGLLALCPWPSWDSCMLVVVVGRFSVESKSLRLWALWWLGHERVPHATWM